MAHLKKWGLTCWGLRPWGTHAYSSNAQPESELSDPWCPALGADADPMLDEAEAPPVVVASSLILQTLLFGVVDEDVL